MDVKHYIAGTGRSRNSVPCDVDCLQNEDCSLEVSFFLIWNILSIRDTLRDMAKFLRCLIDASTCK